MRLPRIPRRPGDAPSGLLLERTPRGWCLVTETGEVAFEANGARSRRECLRLASEAGVLRISSVRPRGG